MLQSPYQRPDILSFQFLISVAFPQNGQRDGKYGRRLELDAQSSASSEWAYRDRGADDCRERFPGVGLTFGKGVFPRQDCLSAVLSHAGTSSKGIFQFVFVERPSARCGPRMKAEYRPHLMFVLVYAYLGALGSRQSSSCSATCDQTDTCALPGSQLRIC